jgi:hypothetical protein
VTRVASASTSVTLWLFYDHNVTRVASASTSVTLWLLYDHNVTSVGSASTSVTLWLFYDHNVTPVASASTSVTLWSLCEDDSPGPQRRTLPLPSRKPCVPQRSNPRPDPLLRGARTRAPPAVP